MQSRSWPWFITAWFLAAAAALPLAAASIPGLAAFMRPIPSAAWLLVAAVALAVQAQLPERGWLRVFGLPAVLAAGLAAWQVWPTTPLNTPWSLGLLGAAAVIQTSGRALALASAHVLVLAGLAGLALPLGGWSPDVWQHVSAVACGLLAIEAFALSVLPPLPAPLAAGLGHGPRQMRRWYLAGRRLFGSQLSLQPLLRALPWIAGGTAILALALSGITAIRLAESGVLLHGGRPVAVLPAGLHVHAPWPWGQVLRVEQGVEHRLSLSGAALPVMTGAVDAPSVQGLDRQWHRSHGREVFFLTAADNGLGDRRGVRLAEIINADIVIHWRVAPGAANAIAAALRTDEPTQLLVSLARRWVQGVFAGETPVGLLGADRASLAERMRASLAAELERLGTGIEVTVVSCEAIHPPLAAAPAFFAAQAAEREARGAVAVAGIRRETMFAESRIQARRTALDATATAAEVRSEVLVRQRETAAESAAWRLAPEAIALERRITAVTSGGDEGRTLTLIDHRLPLPVGLGVDLTAPMRPRHVR